MHGAIIQSAFDPQPIVLALDLAALQIQLGERMVTSENMMSFSGQHALQDMVEMEMYLVSQSQQTPWPLLPRRNQKPHAAMKPCSKSVESTAAEELVGHGFIEATSRRTFVVSKSGCQFYEREIKPHFSWNHKARE